MTLDRILATLTLAAMAAFLATLVGFIREVDLLIVAVIGVALAAYDFYSQLR